VEGERRWLQQFVFVFAVGNATHFNALLSRERGVAVVLNARGSVGPPADATSLVAKVDIHIAQKQLSQVEERPARGVFYRAYKLNPSIWRKWDREIIDELRGQPESFGIQPPPPAPIGKTAKEVGVPVPTSAFIEV
jgi:hypothetical protein